MKSICTKSDMALKHRLFCYTTPEALPLSFTYGDRHIQGIPAEFHPTVQVSRPDANLLCYTICGRDEKGLEIRVEYQEYLDYAVTELLAFFTNTGSADTEILSDVRIVKGVISCENPTLIHGNGDVVGISRDIPMEDGYEWWADALDHPITLGIDTGLSCNGAFPYMRLQCEGYGFNIAIGWPGGWQAGFAPAEGGAGVCIGQKRCHMRLHPGETMRTPRATLMAYTGDEARGRNMWRRWYIDHILPRENGQPLPPLLVMHVFEADGYPEFTGATEQNQMVGLENYLRQGVRPDIWWLDAGWYPCGEHEWNLTGDWRPDPARFPNGLTPIGKKCEENDIRFLLWFEPERARIYTPLAVAHPEWMLKCVEENGEESIDCLVNLGDPACCDAIIELMDGIIKDSHVHIYRQDFNFRPDPYWIQNETEERIGALENLHVQGYLRYWDTLILRNPGLWVDSCAGGGRRNDLETMRRAVPLHYTDVGYGHHPIKQKQHRQMFEWIPYFRAHNMNWEDPATGEYGRKQFPRDSFCYYNAMTPSITDLIEHDASPEEFDLARRMLPIWRRAAEIMLESDFYPLTECRKSAEDYYAVQFHNPDTQKGFVQVIRNNRCPEEKFTACLQALAADGVYLLTEAETGESIECTGAQLTAGLECALPVRSSRIYFYEKK